MPRPCELVVGRIWLDPSPESAGGRCTRTRHRARTVSPPPPRSEAVARLVAIQPSSHHICPACAQLRNERLGTCGGACAMERDVARCAARSCDSLRAAPDAGLSDADALAQIALDISWVGRADATCGGRVRSVSKCAISLPEFARADPPQSGGPPRNAASSFAAAHRRGNALSAASSAAPRFRAFRAPLASLFRRPASDDRAGAIASWSVLQRFALHLASRCIPPPADGDGPRCRIRLACGASAS